MVFPALYDVLWLRHSNHGVLWGVLPIICTVRKVKFLESHGNTLVFNVVTFPSCHSYLVVIACLLHIELDYFALHIPAKQTLSESDVYQTLTHLAGQPPLPFPIFRTVRGIMSITICGW